jgi:hypothetical protein
VSQPVLCGCNIKAMHGTEQLHGSFGITRHGFYMSSILLRMLQSHQATPSSGATVPSLPQAPTRPKRTVPLHLFAVPPPLNTLPKISRGQLLPVSPTPRSSHKISRGQRLPVSHKRHRGWPFLGNTDPEPPPPIGTSVCQGHTNAFREQLAMDVQIVEIRQYDAHIAVVEVTSESTPRAAMDIFIKFMGECQESLNPLLLIPKCDCDADVHVVSKLYATLATIPKQDIELMLTNESRREFGLKHSKNSITMHSIGFLEIAMAAVFQVSYRDICMDYSFRASCSYDEQEYVGAVKMFLCNTIATRSVGDHICSIQVNHLLWGGEYPAVYVEEVLYTCNRMAASCTQDFSLQKDAFDLWQSLCAHVACIEILRLEGMGRDLDRTLTDELTRVLGVEKWLSIETNVDTYEKIVALFISKSDSS